MRCVSAVNPTMSDWKMHVLGRFQASVGGALGLESGPSTDFLNFLALLDSCVCSMDTRV